jgi:hypothetical protein
MSKPIVEIAAIKLGATEADLIAADAFQNSLQGADGFMRRELLKKGEAEYAGTSCIGPTRPTQTQAMAAAVTSPECAAYLALMDGAGALRRFTTLATCGAH